MEWDFNNNAEIDEATLGTAPEGYRGAYTKGDDGKFRIADGFKPFVEAINGLGSALKNERKVSGTLKGQKDASAQVKEALGFETLEEAKARLDELTTAVSTASKVDPAKIRAEIEKTFDVERQTLQGENKTMQATLNRYMVESSAVSALAEAKGNAKLLMPLVREQVELVKDGDEYVVRVKDGQGDYRGNGKGGFMTVEDLVVEMKQSKDYAAAFEADVRPGTHQQQGQRPGQQAQRGQQQEGALPNDRIARGLQARRGR
jgi:hypothetical protein